VNGICFTACYIAKEESLVDCKGMRTGVDISEVLAEVDGEWFLVKNM
jgi:hypothetical protein